MVQRDQWDKYWEAKKLISKFAALRPTSQAKGLLRKVTPVARRVLGNSNEITLRMRWCYATALIMADGSTLDDLRESVTTLEDAERIARRVFGGAHPLAMDIGLVLRNARAALHAIEVTI